MTYKRTIFLINPRFQLKFSLLISVIVFISSLIYPVLIYNLITSYRNNITRNLVKICANEKEEIASISKSVSNQRENLIYLLIFGQLIFTGLIFIISIFFSLKIAGPIYKTQKYLKKIAQGNGLGKLTFRNEDYFKDLADDFNNTFTNLQNSYNKDVVYLNEVHSYLDKISTKIPNENKKALEEINYKIQEIQKRFNKIY
jgi:methyl-accepting chemotaxis protein